MKILVLGSINIDYNYSVGHITTPKETQSSSKMETFPGGKGLNQAVTLARAGMTVQLAGMIGQDGAEVLEKIQDTGVDTSLVRTIDDRTGHAIIQVDEMGQNAILLYGGANLLIDESYVDEVLGGFEEGDVLILQNEISCLQYIIDRAAEKKMFIVLNPSPCTRELLRADLTKVSLFCLNEVEGRAMTSYVQPGDILFHLETLYPDSEFLFTIGSQGAFYKKGANQYYQPAISVAAVDATAAGDVFEGYFLSLYLQKKSIEEALECATYAAGFSTKIPGAAYFSAPEQEQVREFMKGPRKFRTL